MPVLIASFLAGSAPVAVPAATMQAAAVVIARSHILPAAEIRLVDGHLDVRTARRGPPIQVHRTARRDGGETADFY